MPGKRTSWANICIFLVNLIKVYYKNIDLGDLSCNPHGYPLYIISMNLGVLEERRGCQGHLLDEGKERMKIPPIKAGSNIYPLMAGASTGGIYCRVVIFVGLLFMKLYEKYNLTFVLLGFSFVLLSFLKCYQI